MLAESLIPGYPVRAIMHKSKFRGKPGPVFLVYILEDTGDVYVVVTGPKPGFDNIEGREDAWAQEALPKHFPPVSSLCFP